MLICIMPFPVFLCPTLKVWLTLSFTPLSTLPTSPSLASTWTPPRPTPPLPHSSPPQKVSAEDSHVAPTKSWVCLHSLCPLSSIWYCWQQHFSWKVFICSNWDVSWPLSPTHLSSSPWAPRLALLPPPKTFSSFPRWFYSIIYGRYFWHVDLCAVNLIFNMSTFSIFSIFYFYHLHEFLCSARSVPELRWLLYILLHFLTGNEYLQSQNCGSSFPVCGHVPASCWMTQADVVQCCHWKCSGFEYWKWDLQQLNLTNFFWFYFHLSF